MSKKINFEEIIEPKKMSLATKLTYLAFISGGISLGVYQGNEKFNCDAERFSQRETRYMSVQDFQYFNEGKGRHEYLGFGALAGGIIGFVLGAFADPNNSGEGERKPYEGMRGID